MFDGYKKVELIDGVIEVADSTVQRDLVVKRALYAAGGIAEYWVIEVSNGQVHQFWTNVNDSYLDSRSTTLDGEIRSMTMPELAIDGGGIL